MLITLTACAGLLLGVGVPAHAAVTAEPSSITAAPPTTLGSAIQDGALALPANVDPALSVVVTAGQQVHGTVGRVDYGGAVPGAFTLNLRQCPTRGAALVDCVRGLSIQQQPRNASGFSADFVVPNAVGTFLRLVVAIGSSAGSVESVSPPERDLLVLPTPPVGGRAAFAGTVSAGAQTIIAVPKWTTPPLTEVKGRTIAVLACAKASAGQVAAASFDARAAGCSGLPVTGAQPVAAGQTIKVSLPADAAGKFLLVSDTLALDTRGFRSSYVVRSQTKAIGSAGARASASPSAQGAVGASPRPTAAGTVEPFASPEPEPESTADIGVLAEVAGTDGVGTTESGSTGPAMKVSSASTGRRGGKFVVRLSGPTSKAIGEATVVLKVRPSAKARVVQRLKSINVVEGRGARVNTLSRRLPRGTYYLVATFVDDETDETSTAWRRVVVK